MICSVIVCVMFLWAQMPFPTFVFLACGMAGLGYTARLYSVSERRRLSPGMNETCARVCVFAVVAAWIFGVGLLTGFYGFQPEAMGGFLLALGFGLWVGCMEKAAIPALILVYALPFTLISLHDELRPLADAYPKWHPLIHVLAGVAMAAAGLALVVRFIFLTTSRYSPFVFQTVAAAKRRKPQLGIPFGIAVSFGLLVYGLIYGVFLPPMQEKNLEYWLRSSVEVCFNLLVAAAVCGVLYWCWSYLIRRALPSRHSMKQVNELLHGKMNWGGWRVFAWIVGLLFVANMLFTRTFDSMATDKSIHEKIGFGIVLLPFMAGTLALSGFSVPFQRLWIVGASEKREQTARIILLSVAFRSLTFVMLTSLFLVTLGMSSTAGMLPTLFVCTVAIGISAVLVWVIAKWYPFWMRHESFTVIAILVLGGACLLYSIPNAAQAMAQVEHFLEKTGGVPMVVAVVIVSTFVWCLCIVDAARSLGNSIRLHEWGGQLFSSMVNR
jgi:hypothetical protein